MRPLLGQERVDARGQGAVRADEDVVPDLHLPAGDEAEVDVGVEVLPDADLPRVVQEDWCLQRAVEAEVLPGEERMQESLLLLAVVRAQGVVRLAEAVAFALGRAQLRVHAVVDPAGAHSFVFGHQEPTFRVQMRGAPGGAPLLIVARTSRLANPRGALTAGQICAIIKAAPRAFYGAQRENRRKGRWITNEDRAAGVPRHLRRTPRHLRQEAGRKGPRVCGLSARHGRERPDRARQGRRTSS